MKSYEYLIEQFKTARGLQESDENTLEFLKQFESWIIEMKKMSNVYLDALKEEGLDFYNYTTAEVGKGKNDIITAPYNTTIISEVPTNLLKNIEKSRILTGELFVSSRQLPYLSTEKDVKRLPRYIDTFMTQNPYSTYELNDLRDLHNSGNYSIIAGVYGDIYDADRKKKVTSIQRLANELDGNFRLEENTDDNVYYTFVGSGKKSIFLKILQEAFPASRQKQGAYVLKK